VDGVVNDGLCFFQDQWYDFNCLTILSFHSNNGDVNEVTTTATNINILLPVQDGNVANCCRQNIKFVWVQLTINFTLLINVPNQAGPMTLWTEYYIELPQTTHAMVNGNNVS
jgi:hypothetical protein